MIGQRRRYIRGVIRSSLLLLCVVATASAQDVQRGDAVTVTATRTEADPFDVPASIDRVTAVRMPDSQRMQVLMVEDQRFDAMLLRKLLETPAVGAGRIDHALSALPLGNT